MMKLHKPHPNDRFEALGAEIRAAQRHLEERSSDDWTSGIGGLLEGLSHELDEVGPDHDEPHDNAHRRFDSIEQRLGEVKGRLGTDEKHTT
jgi:hypothetical protein